MQLSAEQGGPGRAGGRTDGCGGKAGEGRQRWSSLPRQSCLPGWYTPCPPGGGGRMRRLMRCRVSEMVRKGMREDSCSLPPRAHGELLPQRITQGRHLPRPPPARVCLPPHARTHTCGEAKCEPAGGGDGVMWEQGGGLPGCNSCTSVRSSARETPTTARAPQPGGTQSHAASARWHRWR